MAEKSGNDRHESTARRGSRYWYGPPYFAEVSATRIVLITIFVLSLFIATKSFIAIGNVQEWSWGLRDFFVGSQLLAGRRSGPIEAYFSQIDAIQGQWMVLRWVSITNCALSFIGVILVSRPKKKDDAEAGQAGN
jgi:hypothetical protein